MESEIAPDPVTEALKEKILTVLNPKKALGLETADIVSLVECYRGVRDDDRLLTLQAALGKMAEKVEMLDQRVQAMRGVGLGRQQEPKFGEALG